MYDLIIIKEKVEKSTARKRTMQRAAVKQCPVCSIHFRAIRDSISKKQRFCSKPCWQVSRNHPKERLCLFCKKSFFHRSPDKKFCNMACRNSGYKERVNELANGWKGEDVSYSGLHYWVARHLGKPQHCEQCGRTRGTKRYEWANKSGEYKRDLSDWLRLCVPCHRTMDRAASRLVRT